jgi:hypothetical protein
MWQLFKAPCVIIKNPHNAMCQILMDQQKDNYKLVALKLHSNCFYIVDAFPSSLIDLNVSLR